MSVKRGEVVLVDWPFSGGGGTKVRPALVVQNDLDNQRLTNTIIAMITGQTRRSFEPTQIPVDIATPDGKQTGLRQDSVANYVSLFTVEQAKILRTLGQFSTALMQKVNDCLRTALELP